MAATQIPTINAFVNAFNRKLEAPVRKHLKNVYGCLALSACSAALGAYFHMYTTILQAGLLSNIGMLGLIFALLRTPDSEKSRSMRFGYLLGIAFLNGLGLGPLLEKVFVIDPSIILTAIISTCVVFVSFTIASLLSERRSWLYLGGYLISALNILLLFSMINIFLRFQVLYQTHLYLGLFIMCGFICYDTQLIVEKNRMGSKDFVLHSLDLFLDLVQVFRYLLLLLTQKEADKKKNKK